MLRTSSLFAPIQTRILWSAPTRFFEKNQLLRTAFSVNWIFKKSHTTIATRVLLPKETTNTNLPYSCAPIIKEFNSMRIGDWTHSTEPHFLFVEETLLRTSTLYAVIHDHKTNAGEIQIIPLVIPDKLDPNSDYYLLFEATKNITDITAILFPDYPSKP